MLGLHCYTDFSLVAENRGYSPVVMHGLLTVMASPVVEHRLEGAPASVVVAHGLSSRGSQVLEQRLNSRGAQA